MASSGGSRTRGAQGNKRAKAAKANQGSGLRANAGRSAAAAEVELEPLLGEGAGRDIAGVVIAVIALASLIAVIAPATAPVTAAISGFYHLGFGLGAYVLPFGLLALAALLFLRGGFPLSGRTVAGVALIFVAVLTSLSLAVPYTDLGTAAMFAPENLASSGGYLGAFIASALQGALGKVISYVVAIGAGVLGLVIIGFSISDVVQAAATRARALAARRHVDVNERPWGDPATGAASVPRPARPRQRSLLDEDADAGTQETTYLGNRETTVLAADEPEEDPFVDLSAELAAEEAKTTLIPIKERTAPAAEDDPEVPPFAAPTSEPEAEPAPAPTRSPRKKAAAEPARVLDANTGEQRPIPAFLAPAAPVTVPDADAEGEGAERQLPPASMLRHNPTAAKSSSSSKELEQTAASLQSTLQEFGLRSGVVGWIAGPTVTTFKVQPGEGERVSRINSLEDDIALTLATDSVRIFAPIPGTSLVGIEIPNRTRQTVSFGDILPYVGGGPLEFALGRDAEGAPMVADLAKMPHLLIAGTTGSGKSVVISSIVMSLLMRTFPEDVRLIMIDPKRVEFAPYDGLPHLYVPVVTEPKQAASALQWAVSEMERRLKIFERIGVRKIATFNEKQAAGEFEKYDNPPAKMPYLVIVIDELSDLMMVAGKDVEASIVRIAQLGRAAGIHMIVATQRPSSNVVTGLIKANITNRIGLTVATGIDSRVILDQTGAEKLTGQGDMLFSRVDWGKPKRIQGCYVSDEEIVSVVDFVKEHSTAEYHEEILSAASPAAMAGGGGAGSGEAPAEDDPLLWDAARIVVDSQLGSTSGLQRRLKVGYARAGRIMDMLEEKGVVGPPDGSKPREVLLDMEALHALEALEGPLTDEELGGGF
ncbi:MAG: DNA translocase FtsK 4TM domain-containing protein [Collinsella sp.]|nr:DNA translocase FtsK 4TM domain-containing protein [Collinsella sp.]